MDKSTLEWDTGITLAQWKMKSQHGEFCGIFGCFNDPVVKCHHCSNFYCKEHKWVIETPAHK